MNLNNQHAEPPWGLKASVLCSAEPRVSKLEIPKGTKSGVTWTSSGALGMVAAGQPFPRDPALGEHHRSRASRAVSAKGSFQQHRAKQPMQGSSSPPASTPEWDRIYNPKPFSTEALPEPGVIPSGDFVCGTA